MVNQHDPNIAADVVEGAKKNLNAGTGDVVARSLYLASVVENADELLDVHEYPE